MFCVRKSLVVSGLGNRESKFFFAKKRPKNSHRSFLKYNQRFTYFNQEGSDEKFYS